MGRGEWPLQLLSPASSEDWIKWINNSPARCPQFYALHMDNRAGDCAKRAATVMIYLR
jgi:hypothetical protein